VPVDLVDNTLNVKDLTVTPKPERNWFFDTEKELPPDFFEKAIEDLEGWDFRSDDSYWLLAFELRILYPERRSEIKIPEDALSRLKEEVQSCVSTVKGGYDVEYQAGKVFGILLSPKVLFPNEEFLTKDELLLCKSKANFESKDLVLTSSMRVMLGLKINAGEDHNLWPDFLKNSDKSKIINDGINQFQDGRDLSSHKFWGKLLLGRDFDMSVVTKKDINNWKAEFNSEVEDKFAIKNKLAFGAMLKVATAIDITFGKDGVEFVMPNQELQDNEKPLPERRKY